ncbi:MAG TPA: low molecular weight protein arginine phosphatase [Gemmatimonadales bacterium]|nr:low molecular weight protein arginine phosphatase [Gemmatimonadales bacterium]
MHVLFVCTGNTCRSPMAEALLRDAAAARGLDRVRAGSAGVGAWDGAPASEGAYLVGLEHGLDLSAHRARQLTPALLAEADLVLAMGRAHLARIRELAPGANAHLLAEYVGRAQPPEVSDPFGGNLEGYRTTFEELTELVGRLADRLVAQRPGDPR